MLEVITLYVIDKIFSEAEITIGATSRAMYVSCLIHFFRHKEATSQNAMAFSVFTSEIPNYEKFKKNFQELHKAGIVTINGDAIMFNNVWGRHIDRTRLIVSDIERGFNGKKAEEELLSENKELLELCCMKYKLQEQQTRGMIKLFVKEQNGINKTYKNETDMFNHFYRWCGTNLDKAPTKEVVKSKGKLLGK